MRVIKNLKRKIFHESMKIVNTVHYQPTSMDSELITNFNGYLNKRLFELVNMLTATRFNAHQNKLIDWVSQLMIE